MAEFYPLKFHPIFKSKIWGGQKIKTILGKDFGQLKNCGESWELSCVEGNISIIANGIFAGRALDSLIQLYPNEIMGSRIKFENFPLLIKFLDANDDLSIQVHPNDKLARKKHNGYGKTEMWYIIDADHGARMYVGFNRNLTREEFIQKAEAGEVTDWVCTEEVMSGDAFYIPAGRIHSIGKGILLAEIQQTSDITYRIFDFNRMGDDGKPRDLHISNAAVALNFNDVGTTFKTKYNATEPYVVLVKSPYFTTIRLTGEKSLKVNLNNENSFRIYIVINGEGQINWAGNSMTISLGEVILIPASIREYELRTGMNFCGLEVYIS
jgi:mannose-6-phosphate isomerase